MRNLVPPPSSPLVSQMDHDGLYRLHFRLWQILMTTLTIFVCGWFVTFGVIPAIISLMIAKHVLVAILMVGVELPLDGQFRR